MNNRSKAALLLMRPTFNVDKKIKSTKENRNATKTKR